MLDTVGIVGVLGGPLGGSVDARGGLRLGKCQIDWLVGAEDHWHRPKLGAGVRQQQLVPAPVYETRVRIPSGDAVQHVFGACAANGEGYTVIDIENASPAPFALAIVVRVDELTRGGAGIELDQNIATVTRGVSVVFPRAPMRWAAAADDGSAADVVTAGAAHNGPFPTVHGRRFVEAAFVFPMAHRTTLRLACTLGARNDGGVTQLGSLPDAQAVHRGWVAQLDRAMRVELPAPLRDHVDATRAALLLQASGHRTPPSTVAALEDWGFDDEAASSWNRLSMRERHVASRRRHRADAWRALRRSDRVDDAEFLRLTRDVLVHDRGDEIDLLPGFPMEWVGESIAVHDAPTRAGLVSFAVRWHGDRPALLWDAPEGVVLRAPVLDPMWSTAGGSGEALLAAWPRAGADGGAFS